jgi:hypothetical protein
VTRERCVCGMLHYLDGRIWAETKRLPRPPSQHAQSVGLLDCHARVEWICTRGTLELSRTIAMECRGPGPRWSCRRPIPCRDPIRLCKCHSTLMKCGHGQAVMNIRLAGEASGSGNAKEMLTRPREGLLFLAAKSTLAALGAR